MSGFLLSVPGRLKALLDRVTADRASRLDAVTETRMARLDATVGSRASSANMGTVLDRLTAGRAGNLDEITAVRLARLNADMTSRASQASVDAIPVSIVKSVQTGFVDAVPTLGGAAPFGRHVNIAIASVNVAKSVVWVEGGHAGNLQECMQKGSGTMIFARLTSATVLRIETTGTSVRIAGRWTVVEYN